MVLMAPAVLRAVRDVMASGAAPAHLILPDARGRRFSDAVARELSAKEALVLVCGRYEGFDERAHLLLHADEISLGDYVLSGGELAALVVLDATVRHVPGVVGDPGSVAGDSFTSGLLDHPVYTRPPEVEGLTVPPVLTSGNHAAVAAWRRREEARLTLRRRLDLVAVAWPTLSPEMRRVIEEVAREEDIALPPAHPGETR
jgi:tRNA (guanine37-N1)-methyltransferase